MNDSTGETGQIKAKTRKLPEMPGVFCVKSATKFEEILKLDEEGARITFDYEDDWKELSAAELKQLSNFTQSVYSALKQQRATHDQSAIERSAELVVGKTHMGPPESRARAIAAAGLRASGFRPEQVEEAFANGWRSPKEGEILKGAHRKEGHYEMVRASDGATEQLWLVKDEETFWEDENRAVRERNMASATHSEGIAEDVRRAGFKATTA